MALTALKGKSLRRKKPRRVSSKLNGPNYDNAHNLKGEAYGKFLSYAFDFYRLEHKGSDYKKWVLEYFSNYRSEPPNFFFIQLITGSGAFDNSRDPTGIF